MDFMSAKLLDGRWFRVLTVIDQFTRESLALVADRALSGHRVALALSQVVAERGAPESITADNGSEFAGKAMDAWTYQYDVPLEFIRPGKPIDNGYIESYMDPARVQGQIVDAIRIRLQSYIRPASRA
jgi:putative transposase